MTLERDLDGRSRAMIDAFLTRRGLLRGAAAGSVALGLFGFQMTREIHAQQLTGDSLYDQLGGLVGITAVINGLVINVANDDRISGFFASLPPERLTRLRELLIEQVAQASGGPVRYTGRDMRTTHAGLGVSAADFNALVEDLVESLNYNNVPAGAQQLLLGALAPLQVDIVNIPGPRQIPDVPLGEGPTPAPPTPGPPTPAPPMSTIAIDGKTLAGEPPSTQASFTAVWGDLADTEWVRQHNIELDRLGR
jgi:hemoglobin